MADRDWGSKPGSGGVLQNDQSNIERRRRLRELALDTSDLSKDPYFMKNHLGKAVCIVECSVWDYCNFRLTDQCSESVQGRLIVNSAERCTITRATILHTRKENDINITLANGRLGMMSSTRLGGSGVRGSDGLLFDYVFVEIQRWLI